MLRDTLKRAGWFLLCPLTALLFVGLQALVMYGALAMYSVWAGYGPLDFLAGGHAALKAWRFYDVYLGELLLASQVACLAVGLPLWYFALCRPSKKALPAPAARGVLWGMVPAGIGLQFFSVGIVWLESLLWPAQVQDYNEIMEETGVGRLGWQALLAAVVLAPLVEELFCRGLILHFAQRALRRFWAANLLQALAFAVLHMNWVQGSYAFVCGLIMGGLFHRYRRLGYCMLLHGAVNASSLVSALAQSLLPDTHASMLVLTGLGALLLFKGLETLDCLGPAARRGGARPRPFTIESPDKNQSFWRW